MNQGPSYRRQAKKKNQVSQNNLQSISEKLRQLAANGDLEGVQALLTTSGTEILPSDKESAFYGAVCCGHQNVAQYLLNISGKDITAKYKWLALHSGIKNGHVDKILDLLRIVEKEMDPEYMANLFMGIVNNGDLEKVKETLTIAGEKVSDKDKLSALCSAARNGHLPIVAYLFTNTEILIKDKAKVTLENASMYGQLAIVEFLFPLVSCEISAKHLGNSLKDAARGNHLKTVQYFLKIAGDKILTEDKSIAFSVAASCGHFDIAYELMSKYPEIINNITIKNKLAKQLLAMFEAVQLVSCIIASYPKVPSELVRKIAYFTPAFQALTENERKPVRIENMYKFFINQNVENKMKTLSISK